MPVEGREQRACAVSAKYLPGSRACLGAGETQPADAMDDLTGRQLSNTMASKRFTLGPTTVIAAVVVLMVINSEVVAPRSSREP